jgi:azobenzene reductase
MSGRPTVVAISGSLREGSYTKRALARALATAEEAGAETELIDLREWDLPLFDPDDREMGDSERLKETVKGADALLLGTPVYHGTISSALKNALDYCGFEEFEETTVGLLATAGGGGYGRTLEHLRTSVRTIHGWCLPHEVGIRKAYDQFDDDGEFVDPELEARVAKLGRMAVEYAFIEPTPVTERATVND